MIKEEKQSTKITLREIVTTTVWLIKEGYRSSKYLFIIRIISTVVIGILPIIINYLSFTIILNDLIEIASGKESITSINLWIKVGILFGVGILNILFNEIKNYSQSVSRFKFDEYINLRYLRKKVTLDIEFHESPDIAIIETKVKEAIEYRKEIVINVTINLIRSFIQVCTFIGIFIKINYLLLLLLLIPSVLNFFNDKKYGQILFDIWGSNGEDKRNAYHAYNSIQKLDVIKEAKIYSFSTFLIKKYEDTQTNFINTMRSKLKKKMVLDSLIGFIQVAVFLFIQIFLILQVLAKELLIGNYSFYLINISGFSNALLGITDNITYILENIPYIKDLKGYLAYENKISTITNPIKLKNIAPFIEFKDVWFRYSNSQEYVLKGLSFKINSKEKVAIVGVNGAGKSTIIKLISRFYDVTKGEILVNGTNIKQLDLKEYHKLFSILFQNFGQYWFSLKENIGISNLSNMNNIKKIKNASKKANLGDVINELPKGIDTMLNPEFESGKDISQGQWQKVAIARALFNNPKLLILDEPTSAMDSISEAKIFEEVDRHSNGKTVIMISHRFATVRKANRIIVLDKGIISEEGSHTELMNKKNLYYKMFTTQAIGYK